MYEETFIRLFSVIKNGEVITSAHTRTNFLNFLKIIGSRKSQSLFVGDAFYMKNKSIVNLVIFKSIIAVSDREFPDGIYKCTDVSESKLSAVFIDTGEQYTFDTIYEQNLNRYFFRKVDLRLESQKILVESLNKYFWNNYDVPTEHYEPIFEIDVSPIDSFAQTVLLDLSKKYIQELENGINRTKKYEKFPVVIANYFLKLEEYLKGNYRMEEIDLFPFLSLPFRITRNEKHLNIKCDGDWMEVYKKLRTESYEDFLVHVKRLNIRLSE